MLLEITVFIIIIIGAVSANIYSNPNRKQGLQTKEQLIFEVDD